MTEERRCKLHPGENLTLVEFALSRHGVVIEQATLYICMKCPEYLDEADTFTGELQEELAL